MSFKSILSHELTPSQLKLLENLQDDKIGEYFSSHQEFAKFKKDFENAMNLQICFIMDISGSMSPHSTFTNKVITLVLDALLEFMNKKSKKRYAFIGYTERDEPNNVCHDFSDDVNKIRKEIEDVKLTGGGDNPEDVENALKTFCDEINFDQGGTRIIIHVADAPCHGNEYHNETTDNHPDWSKNIPNLLKRIVNTYNCAYWFIKVSNDTDKMIKRFNQILKEVAPKSELNEIVEMDLRELKSDMIKDLIKTNIFKSTLASASILAKK